MITHFITAKIDLKEDIAELYRSVETELDKHGKPLRWAITAIDSQKGKLILEAVVTKEESLS